jgi:hypothetical protein
MNRRTRAQKWAALSRARLQAEDEDRPPPSITLPSLVPDPHIKAVFEGQIDDVINTIVHGYSPRAKAAESAPPFAQGFEQPRYRVYKKGEGNKAVRIGHLSFL